MIRIFYRVLFVLFILSGLRVAAQSSDVALWIVDSELSTSTIVDEGESIEVDFDEQAGYGFSFNRHWMGHFSTELALQKYAADMSVGIFEAGELRITSVTAMGQWHFNRDGRFAPYVGGGLAFISGEFEIASALDPDAETLDLESEFTWAAAVGANVRLTDHFALTGEMKYVPWDAREEGDVLDEAVEVDPVTFAAGVRFRF